MKLSTLSIPAVMLMAEVSQISAKHVLSPILSPRGHDHIDLVDRAVVERREAQATTTSSAPQSSGTPAVDAPATQMNSTVVDACQNAMASITSVSNTAGFTGCYNILMWDSSTSQFQADLRIYSMAPPSGDFASVPQNMVLAVLNYPNGTTFKSMTKRDTVTLNDRQSGTTPEIQQYYLLGGFSSPMDFAKLNSTQMASLMVPQVTLQASNNGQTFQSTMAPSDIAYFATGQFTQLATSGNEVANPAVAKQAVAESKGFVLPGTSLGIFPTGLIVTSVWALLFGIAYGAGTIARYRYRSMYRKRTMVMSGVTNYEPGIGKL